MASAHQAAPEAVVLNLFHTRKEGLVPPKFPLIVSLTLAKDTFPYMTFIALGIETLQLLDCYSCLKYNSCLYIPCCFHVYSSSLNYLVFHYQITVSRAFALATNGYKSINNSLLSCG